MRTDTPQVGYAPYRQVHAHSTGNRNSTAQNEADYMARKDLNSGFYTHVVGNGRIIQTAPTNRGAWDVGGDMYVSGTLDSTTINGRAIKQNGRTLLDMFYPVGAIFITTVNTNPSSYMGGTWVRFGNGQTLVGVNESDGDFNTAQKTGGEKRHVLTKDEMPSHSHEARDVNGHKAYFWAWTGGPHPAPTL